MNNAMAAAHPAVTPASTTPIPYYPGDVQYNSGLVLETTTHHALYINPPGSIGSTWGAPETYLSDLNLIDSCINNAIIDIEVRKRYAQTEGERRSSGGPTQTSFGVAG